MFDKLPAVVPPSMSRMFSDEVSARSLLLLSRISWLKEVILSNASGIVSSKDSLSVRRDSLLI